LTNSTSVPSVASPAPSISTSERADVVVSPLEQRPSGSSLAHSFASLALGGESVGGWQAAQSSSWSPKEPSARLPSDKSADDSDDDKPIGKTWRPAESAEPTPVCLVFSQRFPPLMANVDSTSSCRSGTKRSWQ